MEATHLFYSKVPYPVGADLLLFVQLATRDHTRLLDDQTKFPGTVSLSLSLSSSTLLILRLGEKKTC